MSQQGHVCTLWPPAAGEYRATNAGLPTACWVVQRGSQASAQGSALGEGTQSGPALPSLVTPRAGTPETSLISALCPLRRACPAFPCQTLDVRDHKCLLNERPPFPKSNCILKRIRRNSLEEARCLAKTGNQSPKRPRSCCLDRPELGRGDEQAWIDHQDSANFVGAVEPLFDRLKLLPASKAGHKQRDVWEVWPHHHCGPVGAHQWKEFLRCRDGFAPLIGTYLRIPDARSPSVCTGGNLVE